MKIFFSVGEPSGDLHGANLIRQLKKEESSIECVGFGGPRMQNEGLIVHRDLTEMAVMMFWQVLTMIPRFYSFYREANRYFASNPVDAVVLIDFPGFNWWIAKAAKRHNIPVFYYGVPQMWAWAPWRIHKLKKRVDVVICKLPFEKSWFEKRGVEAHFVGHPYFDELSVRQLDKSFIQDFDDNQTRLLTLLPGSRNQEVSANLPWMLEAAAEVTSKVKDVSVAIACFNQKHKELARQLVRDSSLPFDIMVDRTPELIHLSDVCLACSGSVSLELMYHRKPSVIVYRVSPLQALLKWLFLKIPYITLVNLFWLKDIERPADEIPDPSSRKIPFPEFARVINPSDEMARHLRRWLNRPEAKLDSETKLDEIANEVAFTGATARAAEVILEKLGHQSVQYHSQMQLGNRRAA